MIQQLQCCVRQCHSVGPLWNSSKVQQESQTAGSLLSTRDTERTKPSRRYITVVVRWQVEYKWRFHSIISSCSALIFSLCSIFRREVFTKVFPDIFIHPQQPCDMRLGRWVTQIHLFYCMMQSWMHCTDTCSTSVSLWCHSTQYSVCNLLAAWAAPLRFSVWTEVWS